MRGSGLVSISFREKSVEEICALCARANLSAVEWGGDVHVPPERLDLAARARALCADAGLAICSYGSYFRAGQPMARFEQNLRAALALETKVLRIWAGQAGSLQADAATREGWIRQMIECAVLARQEGVTVALEYHGQTLTDSRESVLELLAAFAEADAAPAFYWQPRWDWPEEERLASLLEVRPRLSNVHAFTWSHADGAAKRLPLRAGEGMWRRALASLIGCAGEGERYALLEFVEGDCEDALLRDADTLNGWLAEMEAAR